MVNKPRSEEPAKPYKELITSPVYFSNEKWQECLSSHGIIVDTEAGTLTVQSEKVSADMVYDLTEEELSALVSNSIEEHPVEKRLEILNNVIQNDYSDKITLESLNSKERISIALHPEVEQGQMCIRDRNRTCSCHWNPITALHRTLPNRQYCKKTNISSESHKKEP